MYLEGTLIEIVVMLPKFIDAPDMPTLNLIILMFTLDILYIYYSLAFGIWRLWMAKATAKEKRVSRHTTNAGIPTAT